MILQKQRARKLPDVLVIQTEDDPVFQRIRQYYWPDLLRFNGKIPLFLADGEMNIPDKDTLCGFFYQKLQDRYAQVIRCSQGSAYVVLADLRWEAVSTYAKHEVFFLSVGNRTQLYVPGGFACAYLSLENDTKLTFKLERPFEQERELILNPFDDRINVNWPIREVHISALERYAPRFAEVERTLLTDELKKLVVDTESLLERDEFLFGDVSNQTRVSVANEDTI